MKYFIQILIITGLFSLPASAAALKSFGKVHVITDFPYGARVGVDPGFHLNVESPTFLKTFDGKKYEPVSKAAKEIVFQTNEAVGPAMVSFYVCDDSKTVCENHEMQVTLLAAKAFPKKEVAAQSKVKSESPKSSAQVPSQNPTQASSQVKPDLPKKAENTKIVGIPKNENGFIINNYTFALKQAKATGKWLFIDFSASWCPPCLRFDHEVFNKKDFQKISKKYVLLQLDVDKEENYAILEKYKVRAFPTLVMVDGKEDELARFLDYRDLSTLLAELKQLDKKRPEGIAKIKTKAEAGDKLASLQYAQHLFLSLQYEDAVRWFEKAESSVREYHQAKVSSLEEKSEDSPEAKKAYEEALRAAIGKFPDSFYAIDWRVALAKSLGESSPDFGNFLDDAKKSVDLFLEEPTKLQSAKKAGELLELADLAVPELWAYRAEILRLKSKKEEADQAWQKAIDETLKLTPSEKEPTKVIYLTAYMKEIKPLADIEPWFEKLQAAYPTEFTYVFRHAKLLFDNKIYERALEKAQKAFDLSYGSNRFTAGILLAKTQAELKKPEDAKKILSELLSSELAQKERNKRVVENTQQLLNKMVTK